MKTVLSWVSFALGIVLIVCGWFLWGDSSNTGIFTQNIVVSVIVYVVLSIDLLIAWNKPEDKSQRRIGNTGLRWSVLFIYALAAILILVITEKKDATLEVRLFLQGAALVVLIVGYALMAHSASNIGKVDEQQRVDIAGVDKMRREIRGLYNDVLDNGTVPQDIIANITLISEELRFVSPSNNEEAKELERQFVDIVGRARMMTLSPTIDCDALAKVIARAMRTMKERKSIYSN